MNAGNLKFRVCIYHEIQTENKYGEYQKELVLIRQTRADVKYKSGDRITENNEIQLQDIIEFIVRKYVEIDDTTIIIFKGKKYRTKSYHFDIDYQNIIVETEIVNE